MLGCSEQNLVEKCEVAEYAAQCYEINVCNYCVSEM
jgi:hypothetical protein